PNASWASCSSFRKAVKVVSLWLGVWVIAFLANLTVSITVYSGMGVISSKAYRNPISKGALCAMIGKPPIKAISSWAISSIVGAFSTSLLVMPVIRVMVLEIKHSGLTIRYIVSLRSWLMYLTAPIWMILSLPARKPVVSKS